MISSENDDLKASYAKGFAWLDNDEGARRKRLRERRLQPIRPPSST